MYIVYLDDIIFIKKLEYLIHPNYINDTGLNVIWEHIIKSYNNLYDSFVINWMECNFPIRSKPNINCLYQNSLLKLLK
jgi:hypothetical protein